MTTATISSSLGTILKLSIASVLTTILGVRDIDFDPGEVETFERDALADVDYLETDCTGRTKGGKCSGSMFYDPAAATNDALVALINSVDADTRDTAWQVTWSDPAATTQPFVGPLVKLTRSAKRGEPLMSDFEIAISQKPTLA